MRQGSRFRFRAKAARRGEVKSFTVNVVKRSGGPDDSEVN
jgi:hypothetical protein